MSKATDSEALRNALLPICEPIGIRLYDVEIGPSRVLVMVERDGGLDLDVVAEASRAFSELLDADESLVPGSHYELEVSSPGVERRLRLPEHFRGALNERIAVRTTPGTPGERRFEAELVSADDDGIVVRDGAEERTLSYGAIDRAHTIFDWRAALSGRTEPKGAQRRAPDGRDEDGADAPIAANERAEAS